MRKRRPNGGIMGQNYKRKVERILYSYPALLAAIECDEVNLFPSVTANYGEGGGAGSITSTTEKYGIMRAEKKLKVDAIARGLAALTYTERDLIQQKYFNPAQPKDAEVCEQINVGSTTYYKFKEQALHKMAIALNII
jgi:ArpU family phage transcriptional regulator